MIAIMDYGVGNLGSVKNALDYLNYECVISDDKNEILKADKIILPGVGAFGDAIKAFREKGFDEVILKAIEKNIPILGICVGMQLLFECSYEYGIHKGLSIFKGNIIKFDDSKYKVPHMGWNKIKVIKDNPLLKGLDGSYFYFVHSYHLDKSEENELAVCEYADVVFPCVVGRGNIYATQFHPEKSGEVGLKLLKNFGDL